MNLLPLTSQKAIRGDLRARFLFVFSLVVLCGAALSALMLLPAELGLIFSAPPETPPAQNSTINAAQDGATAAHTRALLALVKPFTATSSLDDILAALSQVGLGVTVNTISYSVTNQTLTLNGHAVSPDEVNTYRQNLQSDLRFSQVSVPVSALLGSQNGAFTITMKVNQQ